MTIALASVHQSNIPQRTSTHHVPDPLLHRRA